MIVWHFYEQIFQIFVYVQVIGTCALYQCIQYSICKSTLRRICKQPCTSCCCKWLYVCLTKIIRDWQPAIFHKSFKIFFLVCGVMKCLGQVFICRIQARGLFQPRPKGIKDEARCILTLLFSFFNWQVFDLCLYSD